MQCIAKTEISVAMFYRKLNRTNDRKLSEEQAQHMPNTSPKLPHKYPETACKPARQTLDTNSKSIWPNPQILCQELGRLNLPVTVSTPEEFVEKGLGNTAWQAKLYYLVNFMRIPRVC